MNLDKGIEFQPWPKIPRLVNENITITEKMDGTNACIIIQDGEIVGIQSRKRFIEPAIYSGTKGSDNMGFALWVSEHENELLALGDGHHYGEWCGVGIQKNPHNLQEKKFFLFNTQRWGPHNPNTPECCSVVAVLFIGKKTDSTVEEVMKELWIKGKHEGYHPEGIIIFNHLAKNSYKVTYENAEGKWL